MKKIFTNITLIFLSFFIVITGTNARCMDHSSSQETCESYDEDKFQCVWDGTKTGNARCYKGSTLSKSAREAVTKCSDLPYSDCDGNIVNGNHCKATSGGGYKFCGASSVTDDDKKTIIDGVTVETASADTGNHSGSGGSFKEDSCYELSVSDCKGIVNNHYCIAVNGKCIEGQTIDNPEDNPSSYSKCSDLPRSQSICETSVFNYTQCVWDETNGYCASGEEMVDIKEKINGTVIDAGISTSQDTDNNIDYPSENYETCSNPNTLKALKILGECVYIAKILVPLILILTGVASLVNAVVADDEKEIKTAVNIIIKKFFVGVFVFFIPTIVFAILNFAVNTFSESDFTGCKDCLNNNTSCAANVSASSCDNNSYLLGNVNDQTSAAYYLQTALNYIKYAGIVVCIILTIFDIVKGLTTDNKGLSQEIAKTFFKRMIYASLLFFLPSIVNIILEMIGVIGTCGIS